MHTSSGVKESAEYQALEKYIAGGSSREDALNAFCGQVETKSRDTQDSEDLEEPLWQAWRAVVTMAASIPHTSENRQKLVDFVMAVQKRSSPQKNGQSCVVHEAKVWQDLPIFGMEMREAWNLAATQESNTEQQEMWVNLNAWTASLVATVQAAGQSTPDFSLYCIWTVRMALEEETPSSVAVQAATVWFLYAVSSIYQLCLAGKTFDGKVAKPGSACKDREWRGFSQSRWATWVRRMGALEKAGPDGDAGSVVADAVKAMKAVDGASCARR